MIKQDFYEYLYLKRIPVRAIIQLTYHCNFRCVHCYETPLNRNGPLLSLDEWKKILDLLRNAGCLYVTFTGGEIFSIPYFKELYEYAYMLGFQISLITNGSLIKESDVQFLCDWRSENINISLYGMTEETYEKFCKADGAYSKVINNILLLKSKGLHVTILYLTNKLNLHELEVAYKFACKNGCLFYQYYRFRSYINGDCFPKSLQVAPFELISAQPPKLLEVLCYKTLEQKTRWENGFYQCNAGITNLTVDPHGQALLCDNVPAKRYSLIDYSFDYIWNELLEQRKKYIEVKTICSTCERNSMCGLCAPNLMKEYGGYFCKPNQECSFNQHMIEECKKIK